MGATGRNLGLRATLPLVILSLVLASCQAGAEPTGTVSNEPTAVDTEPTGVETTWERIQRTGVVRLGISNEPPFSIQNLDGTVTGQAPEVLRAALAPYNIELESIVTEGGGLIPGLQADRFDVVAAGFTYTSERCSEVAFGNPDSLISSGLMVLKGNPKDIHSYEDIAENPDTILGVVSGSSYIEWAVDVGIPEDRMLTFPEALLAKDALEAGRVDAFASPRTTALWNWPDDPVFELADPFTPPPGVPDEVYLGAMFRTEDTDFIEAYNAELAKLYASGELLEINSEFGFDVLPPADLTAEELCNP
jgi:polar amino acid transport system substrate-binding protein